jgi:hypothetical protein
MKPREIEDRLREAFTNFNLTNPPPNVTTPKESTLLWNNNDNLCELSPDVTTDADLCTFATHWLVASIKNGTAARVKTAFNAGAAGAFALLLPGLFLAQDNSLRAYAALTVLGLTAVNAPVKLAEWIKTRCDKESFSLASAKLFEKEKYAALLSYFTHLQMQDHTPLSYDEKSLLMQKVASNNNAQLYYAVSQKASTNTISTSLQRKRKDLTPSKTVEINQELFKNYELGRFPLSLKSIKI